MNTLHVFLALVWVALIIVSAVAGWIFTADYALKADRKGYPVWKGLGGTVLHALGFIILTACIIGVPLDVMGF